MLIIQHCTRHSESKIGFGDLILLPRYFFKQQMSTDPIRIYNSFDYLVRLKLFTNYIVKVTVNCCKNQQKRNVISIFFLLMS